MSEIGKKKTIIITCIIVVIILVILAISLYISQRNIRDWVDIHLLGKNITTSDVNVISLNSDKTNQIHVYSKYVAILNEKTVKLYNSYGENVTSIDVNINTAIFDSSNKYLAIAEKGGKEVCLILDKTYLWSTEADSEILQVHVNRNGYVAVVTTDIANKSILTFYTPDGNKVFSSYFASTRIIDVSISDDNKYIAVGELDSSGTTVQSNIKTISVDNAKKKPENTIIYTYRAEPGRLIANVEYQDNGQIICVFDNGIEAIKNENSKDILKIENETITYVSCELNNNAVYIEEKSDGLFDVSSNIHIINTSNNQDIVYKLEDIAKQIYSNENIIAINTGTEIYFINTGGWLVKKFTSNQEITNVKISANIAVIIYKDKIEIIGL